MVLPGLSLAGKQKHADWASLSRCMGHGDFVFRISLFQHLLDMNFTESEKVRKHYRRFHQRQHSNTIVWIFLFSCSLRWVKPNTTSFVLWVSINYVTPVSGTNCRARIIGIKEKSHFNLLFPSISFSRYWGYECVPAALTDLDTIVFQCWIRNYWIEISQPYWNSVTRMQRNNTAPIYKIFISKLLSTAK